MIKINKPIEISPDYDHDKFHSISEFKWCIQDGGEVVFIWKDKTYSVTHPNGIINFCESSNNHKQHDIDSINELLNLTLGEDKLRDVITKVTVIERTL